MKVSADLRKSIRNSANLLSSKTNMSNQDWNLIETLIKLLDVLDETPTLRKNLISLRKDLELWKTENQNENETRAQLIELTIELVNLFHYCTLLCNNFNSIYKRYKLIKANIIKFKENNNKSLNRVDKTYVGYLFKMPKLIIIKRGYLDMLNEQKKLEQLEDLALLDENE